MMPCCYPLICEISAKCRVCEWRICWSNRKKTRPERLAFPAANGQSSWIQRDSDFSNGVALMAIVNESESPPANEPPSQFQPYIPASKVIPEFTWPAVVVGALLGIIFGASSLYLLLKVGMTVSASVPIAVLSITLFRVFSKVFGFRRATILENNIVQTTGSAGESIAFGVGVTMPALLLLGFEMEVSRVMTVSILGGILGILMMIPLRRAFIVKQR